MLSINQPQGGKPMSKGKFYLTTAIAYTSGKPHIGNTYEIVLADAICRFRRLLGYDVYFQTGTDEHGQKIEEKAAAAGVAPQVFVDSVAAEIKRIWDVMDTSYDRFVRTTDPVHEAQVQKIFNKLYEQGDIYKDSYKGLYCTPCESFWTDSQLVGGKCPDCGRDVKEAEEEAYFFKLSKYTDRLIEHIEKNPSFIQPEARKNEMINNFLKPGLQDLCVSRTSFKWGIPVTFDPKHVIYVWIDALSNYITLPGYDTNGNNGETFKKYWPADVHLIGKDILRFHTIYWPIMLMALGVELPRQVFGHPWLLVGDGKMSKSKGNVVYADELVDAFGVDAVRYFMLHEMPFASDGTFTHELLIERINSDLANIFGNLVNRTLAMCLKYSGGVINNSCVSGDFDSDLISLCLATPSKVEAKMMDLRVADAIDEIFTLLRRANKYIDETQPWILGKDSANKSRLDTVLYNLLETIRFAATLLSPFLPSTGKKIFEQLGVAPSDWDSLGSFDGLKSGHKIAQPEILFARIDMQKKLEELEAAKPAATEPPEKKELKIPEITIDEFAKTELRVARIVSAEPVPKSDKLLKLKVDLGGETRQVVSGIRKWYEPSDLIGKNVILVSNLVPAKLRGEESQGMILAADSGDSARVIFVDGDVAPGAKIR
jgi:methionyl-tRNA synthetase